MSNTRLRLPHSLTLPWLQLPTMIVVPLCLHRANRQCPFQPHSQRQMAHLSNSNPPLLSSSSQNLKPTFPLIRHRRNRLKLSHQPMASPLTLQLRRTLSHNPSIHEDQSVKQQRNKRVESCTITPSPQSTRSSVSLWKIYSTGMVRQCRWSSTNVSRLWICSA